MKTTKKAAAIFFAFIVLISVFAGCAKNDGDKDITRKTTISSCKEDESDKTTQEDKTQSLASIKIGDTITFGQYEQDNDFSNGKEPIEWRVLATESAKVLLISEQCLDCKHYDDGYNRNVTWETCTMRSWLNNEFYNTAFNVTEQAKIKSSTVVNEDNPWHGTDGGNATSDRIFLLSIEEAEKYFTSNSTRLAKPTQFTVDQGAYEDEVDWWLRSPGLVQGSAAAVIVGGDISSSGHYVNGPYTYGVRPALWVNLTS